MVGERRLGIIRVDGALLCKALGLPEGTELEDVRVDFACPGAFEIRLTSPALAPVAEGNLIPRYMPRFDSSGFVAWDPY